MVQAILKDSDEINLIKNPTKKQLRRLKSIIYKITNNINGMSYIGKTYKEFYFRYRIKWWTKTHSKYLNRAALKYGPDNFSISILDYNIPLDELSKREVYFIKKYNSLKPNGYNLIEEAENGRIFSEEMKNKMALAAANGKTYKIKEMESGEIFEFPTQKAIRDKYGIKKQNLNLLLNGKRRSIRGLCLPDTDPRIWLKSDKIKLIKNKNGKIYEVGNSHQFEKEHGLNKSSLSGIFNKRILVTKGFRLPETPTNYKSPKAGGVNVRQKYSKVILTRIIDEKDFEINIPSDLGVFCEENKILRQDIYALTSREQKTAKGFKFKNVELLKR